jgi:hypothetical protein
MTILRQKKHVIALVGILCITAVIASIAFINTKDTNPKSTYIAEVVLTPTAYITIPPPQSDISSWRTFTDQKLQLSMKYPPQVMLDPRQTSQDRIYAFIFTEDKVATLPGNVTALYLADTNKKGVDGFSAFRKGDCGTECPISYKKTAWVNINNVYGIKNQIPGDVHNYFLTDKNMSGSVVNAYVGGYITEEKDVQDKIEGSFRVSG